MIEDFFSWSIKKFKKYEDKYNKENEGSVKDFDRISKILRKEGLTKKTLIEIGRWKNGNGRSTRYLNDNDDSEIKEKFDAVEENYKNTKNMKGQLMALRYRAKNNGEGTEGLKGVQIPIASAILTMRYPKDYYVTDYKILNAFLLKPATSTQDIIQNQLVTSMSMKNYCYCYEKIKKLANKCDNKTPRQIEKAIWIWYKTIEQDVKDKLKK